MLCARSSGEVELLRIISPHDVIPLLVPDREGALRPSQKPIQPWCCWSSPPCSALASARPFATGPRSETGDGSGWEGGMCGRHQKRMRQAGALPSCRWLNGFWFQAVPNLMPGTFTSLTYSPLIRRQAQSSATRPSNWRESSCIQLKSLFTFVTLDVTLCQP